MWLSRKPKIELKQINDIAQALRYTPDAAFLETVNPWLIFVCDDLQKMHHRHQKLLAAGAENPNFRNPSLPLFAYTESSFVLWKHNDGRNSFCVPLDEAPRSYQDRPAWDLTGPQLAKIKGQVYKIGWKGIAELDEHYRNTVEYVRCRIRLVIPHHYLEEFHDHLAVSLRHEAVVTAWMYIGIKELWNDIMDGSFVPVRKVKPKSEVQPVYYFFTQHEYKD